MNFINNMKVYILASLVPVILVLIFGDSMYVGLWYYILIPIAAWIIVTPLQPNSSFFSGMGVAIALSYMPFLISNWISDMPHGFILFWHLFSLPGIVVGALVGAYFCNYPNEKGEVIFLKGFGSIVVGFLLAIIVSVVIS